MKKILSYMLFNMIILTSFSYGVNIASWKTSYASQNAAWINLQDKPNNTEDWVGIYPANSNSDWGNVVAWAWARDTTKVNGAGDWYKFTLADGNYEARFYLNNTFTVEESVPFSVGNSTHISLTKKVFSSNERVSVSVSNLSGDQDWVGIYPKNADNSWGNVIAWNWVTADGAFTLSTKKKEMPAGEYEARLFFHNSYAMEARVGFSVEGDNNGSNFGTVGQFNVTTKINPRNADMKFHYSPNNTNNAPVAIFCSAGNSFNKTYLMKFIASQGYFAVEAKQRNNDNDYVAMIDEIADRYHVDTSKVVLLGYSLGGSYIYEILKALKANGYAKTKSGLVSLDGYLAKDMNVADMQALNTEALLLMFGGVDGTSKGLAGHQSYQDPRVFLGLYRLLEGNNEVSLYPIEANDSHGYLGGNANSVESYARARQDVIKPVHAFLHHILTYRNGVDYGGNMVMISDTKFNEVERHLLDEKSYRYKCHSKYLGKPNYCKYDLLR